LTRLAAEGQAKLLGSDAESLRAAELISRAWPEQSYDSLAVVALHRREGLTPADRVLAERLAARFRAADRPGAVLRVLGPGSPPEVAERLVSRDGTVELVAVPLSTSFVQPATHAAVAWLLERAGTVAAETQVAAGLELDWTGDAVIGRDYMASVYASLDRAALATVALLLVVLLVVYRSVWLAMVPLATIGVSLVIARGVLAWLTQAGWAISPLVELFLVALLFGAGTDFCLFLSWRYGEHWNPHNPAGAMRATMRRAFVPLLTSAGTVIIGLALMGTTRFQLFSSTGPSVALGLALTLAAALSLTPALLVLLARHHPRAFRGLSAPSTGFWDRVGRTALARPRASWLATLLAMLPLALLGLRTHFVQDLLTELPAATPSAGGMRLIADKFGAGEVAPLSVVLEADGDLRRSPGLALIDDLSRLLAHQRRLVEVRSATQPMGSTAPLERARLAARLGAVHSGFARITAGAGQLQHGLNEGAAKLRAALWLGEVAGLNLGRAAPSPAPGGPAADASAAARCALVAGLKQASAVLLRTGATATVPGQAADHVRETPRTAQTGSALDVLIRELTRAAEGAGRIAAGAGRASHEVASILEDPVGRRALDRLLITPETVRDHPELNRSFDAYITPDGRRARIDLTQADPMFSAAAMDQVQTLRRRLNDYLGEVEGLHVRATITGPNAEAADIRALTESDQRQSWILVPIGVFLVLVVALRDPVACVNLVATMVLSYAFALGAAHLVFVTILGAEGLDWKVPYFLFVLLVAVGVDYNVFLMTRLREEAGAWGLRAGIVRAIAQTGGLISSAAAITVCSFAAFLLSPLGSLRQLGFALVVGLAVDALLVRPVLVPCGHWLLSRRQGPRPATPIAVPALGQLAPMAD
jgi:RND superfamily putative drug exporter